MPGLRRKLQLLMGTSAAIAALSAFAETPPAPSKEEPVSQSYTQLIKCFPELRNGAWTKKVALNELKESIDTHFPTTDSLLRFREVLLKELETGVQHRMRLAARSTVEKGQTKITRELSYEKLGDKKGDPVISLPVAHKTNPPQKEINSYFVGQEVLQDETSYFDSKLKGITLSYKKSFKDVTEIELKDSKRARRVLCEDQKDLGTVCTCFSK